MKRNNYRSSAGYMNTCFKFIKSLPPVLIILFISNCGDNPADSPARYQYSVPVQLDDGWETSSLTGVGLDEGYFVSLMNELEKTENHRIHSLLIIKNGKLVFEEYFHGDKFNLAQFTGETGFDMNDTHNLCSATKSFTSALIGIAIDKHFMKNVKHGVFEFFPEYQDLLVSSPEKRGINIEHLITMASGITWDDETYSYQDSRNDLTQMFNSSDPIRYVLSKDLYATPGTMFRYSNCNSNVLGEIIKRSSGQRLDDFARDYLFSKLGITNYEWQMMPNNVVFASGDLRLCPRDMAKFGYLFLKKGMWGEERIISEEWVDISTTKFFDVSNDTNGFDWADGYGYHWWQWERINGIEFNAYFAAGWGGQWIIVNPENELVIVSTAGNYYTDVKIPIETIISDYLLPSIR